MKDLKDVDKAIEFAKEQDDAELWEDLILYSIDKPRKQCSLCPLYYNMVMSVSMRQRMNLINGKEDSIVRLI